MTEACNEERFLRDVAEHKLEVIRDDGVNRHLRFQKEPKSSVYRFDLITWPGHLCFTGDMGTYVFSRIEDMFEFFITGSSKEGLNINTGYWAEKVLSVDRNGGIEAFSAEKFERAVKHDFDRCFEDSVNEEYTEKLRAECWDEIEEQILSRTDSEHDAYSAAYDFEHNGFTFVDFFEHDFKVYTFRYLWCLYAIVWGIQQYNQEKERDE